MPPAAGNAADHEPGANPGRTEDRELAARVRRGDREAFERLVRRYLRPIHALVASFLAEPADVEDAVQETFLRALDGIEGYDPGRPFAPWLYQVARNVARNRLAARARHPTESLPEGSLPAGDDGPEADLRRSEIRRRVEAAARQLPERQRAAFRLVDVEGYAASEAASMMGLAPGTVRSHLHHARRALREELAPWLERQET